MEELWKGLGDNVRFCDNVLDSVLLTLQLPGSSYFACTLRRGCSPGLVSQAFLLGLPLFKGALMAFLILRSLSPKCPLSSRTLF